MTCDNPRNGGSHGDSLRPSKSGIKPTGQAPIPRSSRTAGRPSAARWTLGREGDVIVLAGKGHETYQEIMGVKRPFDEKVVVQELLRELRKAGELA